MPDALAGAHPFHAASPQDAGGPVGLLVADAALGDIGQSRDAGMRMEAEGWKGLASVVDQIEEDERLEDLAQVAGAHQPGDRTVRVASRAVDDPADWIRREPCSDGHDEPR